MAFKKSNCTKLLSWIALYLALAGCAADTEMPSADISIAEQYDTKLDRTSTKLTREWDGLFRNDELTRLIGEAREHNFDIQAAVARIAQSEALTRAAFAPLLPNIGGNADASHTRTPGTERTTSGPFASTQSNQFSLGLTASYVLDIWGRYRAAYEAQNHALIATRFDKATLEITTLSLVASNYMSYLAARERLAVGQNNIKLATKILAAIKARLEVGTASALDLAQQEGVVASQKAALPPLELQIRQSQNQLALLLGRPPEGFNLNGQNLSILTIPKIAAGLPSDVLTQRPDIASAEANLKSAQASISAARKAFLPNMTLTASGGLESLALKNLTFPQAQFSTFAAGLTQPIFDSGSLGAQLDLSRARRNELLADYQKAIVNAFTDVENALVAIKQSAAQLAMQRQVVAAAQRAYMISEERLRAGTIDIVTLLNVQQTMFQAQDGLIQAHLTRLQASLSLIQALGGGMRDEMHDDHAALGDGETGELAHD
jgi:outer membrane protein, multidrug efflux system